MTRPVHRLRPGLLILVLGLYVGPLLAGAAPARAQPLPLASMETSRQPLPTMPRAERASRRGVLVLIIGGVTVTIFVVLTLTGFFDQKK